MKVLLYFFAIIAVITSFNVFQTDWDVFSSEQEKLKHIADDCSAAAMLYYDEKSFSEGVKIFNKTQGNKAVEYILKHDLKKEPKNYFVYYFDGDGKMYKYHQGQQVSKETITYPYIFTEALSGYQSLVKEPRVSNSGLRRIFV